MKPTNEVRSKLTRVKPLLVVPQNTKKPFTLRIFDCLTNVFYISIIILVYFPDPFFPFNIPSTQPPPILRLTPLLFFFSFFFFFFFLLPLPLTVWVGDGVDFHVVLFRTPDDGFHHASWRADSAFGRAYCVEGVEGGGGGGGGGGGEEEDDGAVDGLVALMDVVVVDVVQPGF